MKQPDQSPLGAIIVIACSLFALPESILRNPEVFLYEHTLFVILQYIG